MKNSKTTVSDATHEWVMQMNRIPLEMLQAAIRDEEWKLEELTQASKGDRVYFWEAVDVCGNRYEGHGRVDETFDKRIRICTDNGEMVLAGKGYVEVEREMYPMWGSVWNLDDSSDEQWVEEHTQIVSDLGFRIYRHEEYGIFLGIDGAGYDFYEEHWVPLYKARGLMWHDEEVKSA